MEERPQLGLLRRAFRHVWQPVEHRITESLGPLSAKAMPQVRLPPHAPRARRLVTGQVQSGPIPALAGEHEADTHRGMFASGMLDMLVPLRISQSSNLA